MRLPVSDAVFSITANSQIHATTLRHDAHINTSPLTRWTKMRQIDKIVIHCTAASGDQPTQDILNYWRKKGWSSNGYHWLVDGNGIAVRLMPDDLVSNGVKGHNSKSIHLCYKGGWNGKDTRTEAQKETLKVLVDQYRSKWPNAEVLGHRDLSPDLDKDGIVEPHEWVKLCPCFDARKEYKSCETVK